MGNREIQDFRFLGKERATAGQFPVFPRLVCASRRVEKRAVIRGHRRRSQIFGLKLLHHLQRPGVLACPKEREGIGRCVSRIVGLILIQLARDIQRAVRLLIEQKAKVGEIVEGDLVAGIALDQQRVDTEKPRRIALGKIKLAKTVEGFEGLVGLRGRAPKRLFGFGLPTPLLGGKSQFHQRFAIAARQVHRFRPSGFGSDVELIPLPVTPGQIRLLEVFGVAPFFVGEEKLQPLPVAIGGVRAGDLHPNGNGGGRLRGEPLRPIPGQNRQMVRIHPRHQGENPLRGPRRRRLGLRQPGVKIGGVETMQHLQIEQTVAKEMFGRGVQFLRQPQGAFGLDFLERVEHQRTQGRGFQFGHLHLVFDDTPGGGANCRVRRTEVDDGQTQPVGSVIGIEPGRFVAVLLGRFEQAGVLRNPPGEVLIIRPALRLGLHGLDPFCGLLVELEAPGCLRESHLVVEFPRLQFHHPAQPGQRLGIANFEHRLSRQAASLDVLGVEPEHLVQGGVEGDEIVLLKTDPGRKNEPPFLPDQVEVARDSRTQKQDHAHDENQRPSGEMRVIPRIQFFKAHHKAHGLGRPIVSR